MVLHESEIAQEKIRHGVSAIELCDKRRTCDGLYVHFDIICRNYLQEGRDDALLAGKLSCEKDAIS